MQFALGMMDEDGLNLRPIFEGADRDPDRWWLHTVHSACGCGDYGALDPVMTIHRLTPYL
jgi:hypothetical protein